MSLRLLPHPGRGGAGNVTVGSDQPQPVFEDRRTKLGIGSMLEETLNEVMSALRLQIEPKLIIRRSVKRRTYLVSVS
jgi:hypothetical protein